MGDNSKLCPLEHPPLGNKLHFRSQTKCLANTVTTVDKSMKNLKPDTDFVLTSLTHPNIKPPLKPPPQKSKSFIKLSSKVPLLPDKRLHVVRTISQDTEISQNTSSGASNELLKLPPILVPIISRLEKQSEAYKDHGNIT